MWQYYTYILILIFSTCSAAVQNMADTTPERSVTSSVTTSSTEPVVVTRRREVSFEICPLSNTEGALDQPLEQVLVFAIIKRINYIVT